MHFTSPVSLSRLTTLIVYVIIPSQHKQNGNQQFEAELFKNKIKNRALLVKLDPENLSHITYTLKFSQQIQTDLKNGLWSLWISGNPPIGGKVPSLIWDTCCSSLLKLWCKWPPHIQVKSSSLFDIMHTGHTFQLTAQTLEEKTIAHTGHVSQLTAETVMKMTITHTGHILQLIWHHAYRSHIPAYCSDPRG